MRAHGWTPDATAPGDGHPVQRLELAVDTLDEARIRPFWAAVFDYVDGPDGDLIDPRGTGPSIWFQHMAAPRPQRNRIHFDLTVPHDLVSARLDAALAAGGRLVSAEFAPSYWVLADPEGNEICLCTWLARDERRDAARAAAAGRPARATDAAQG